MMHIPMYPQIKITRTNDTYTIKNNRNEVELTEDSDLFFEGTSLRHALEGEPNHEIEVSPSHTLYKYCNDLLFGRCKKRFVIYDCEFDRWMCLTNDGDVEWTATYDDEDIDLYQNECDAEEMIPFDDADTYAVQTRYYASGALD